MGRFRPRPGTPRKRGQRTGLSASHPALAREVSILGQKLAKEFPGLQPHIRLQLYNYLRGATTEAEKRRLIDLAYLASHVGALESSLGQQSFLRGRLQQLNQTYMRFAVKPIATTTFSMDLRQLDAQKERMRTALGKARAKAQKIKKTRLKRQTRK